ncbi:MAG TPA: hypothetical protein VJS66_05145 [Burkholderiales bacterium]|nr:hypothetical protein [Burkholderiales bacterium]
MTTAVGLDKHGTLLIGVNQLYKENQQEHNEIIDNRLREIGEFLDARKRNATETLQRKEFSPRLLETAFSRNRLQRDLNKLSRSLNREYEKGSRRNLPEEFRDAVRKRRFVVFATGTGKHAELEVAKNIDSGPIGVTRLNCLNCWEDLPAINKNVETRGTHNFRFPNQVSTGKTTGYFITTRQQFPEDSDSDDE